MKSTDALIRSVPLTLALMLCATAANAQLSISPSSLSFTVQNGVASPQQLITVNASIPTTFTVTSSPNWLTVANQSAGPANGPMTTPITLIVAVAPNPPSTSQTGAIIIAQGVGGGGTTVPVTLTVTAPAPSGNLIVNPSTLSFDYQSGGPNPSPAFVSILSSGAPINFTVNAASSGGPWLSVSASTFSTPATATVSAVPSIAMSPGVYSGTITVSPVSGGVTQTVSVTLRISSGGTLTLSPASLTFSYQPGSPAATSQSVTVVNSSGGNTPYNLACSPSTGSGPWISCVPANGTTPSSFVVSVNPGGMSPGTYYATVSVYPLSGAVPASQIPVTLTVYNLPTLLVSPSNLTFDYISGGAPPASQYVSASSTGAPMTFAAVVNGPSFIKVSPSNATTPAAIAVNVTPAPTLAPGDYQASVVLTPTAGNPVTFSVLVRITAANYISVSQSNISFEYTIGSSNPAPAYVYVTSSGGSIRFDAVSSSSGYSPWMKVSQSSPYTPATVAVIPSAQGLAAGTYSGYVSIVANDANNSPVSFNVTLTVSNAATFRSSPWGMSFSYQFGQSNVPFQAAVITSSGAPLSFGLTVTTTSGSGWLLATGGGTTPATIAAQVNPKSLTPGTYSGTINVQPTDPTIAPLEIPVILNVSAGEVFEPSANQLTFQYQIGAPTPPAQTATINTGGVPVVFTTTTITGDGGQWLAVTPTSAYAPGAISATVSPQGLAKGLYYAVIVVDDPAGNTPTAYIPVSLQVSDGPILSVPGQFLTFNGIAGGMSTTAQQITVGSNGPPSQFHVTTSGGTWLQASPTDGFSGGTVSVWAVPDGLPVGYYLGLVSIGIPGLAGSEQLVPVVFLVMPAL
jgi:hypothetical protein